MKSKSLRSENVILIIINWVNFCFESLQELLKVCEAISNTRIERVLEEASLSYSIFKQLELVKKSFNPLVGF